MLTSLEIVVDPERSAWVMAAAQHAGFANCESFIAWLIDEARASKGRQGVPE